jgi:hypothetical protein
MYNLVLIYFVYDLAMDLYPSYNYDNFGNPDFVYSLCLERDITDFTLTRL